jgi:hypothetical protein
MRLRVGDGSFTILDLARPRQRSDPSRSLMCRSVYKRWRHMSQSSAAQYRQHRIRTTGNSDDEITRVKLEVSGTSKTRPIDSCPIMSRSGPGGGYLYRPDTVSTSVHRADGERLHEAAHLEAWLRDVEKACGAELPACYLNGTHSTESGIGGCVSQAAGQDSV